MSDAPSDPRADPRAPSEPPLRVGLVGAGRWGAVHREALARVGAELVAVAVATPASAARVEADWGVPADTDLDALLARDLEAVIVASPNHLHAVHGEAALAAGKHLLVEKPMAITVADCERLQRAAATADRVLAVGLEMRVFGLFRRVKELLAGGALGAPLHLHLRLWRRPYRAGAGGWKQDPAKLGSSVLEEPIHYLDLARWYLGEPRSLQAWASSRADREALRENLDVRLAFAGGAQALVTRSIAAWGHAVTLELVAEGGALRARWQGTHDTDPQPRVSLVVHDADGVREEPVSAATGHAFDVPRQTRAFVEAIRGRGAPAADGHDGCASVALSLAVERSLEAGSAELELAPPG